MSAPPSRQRASSSDHFTFRSLASVPHLITSRHGGVSVGTLESLNVSFAVGDDPANVIENRRRALALLGASPESAVFARQVHRTHITAVTGADRGRGATAPGTSIPDCDGLVTSARGVWLVLTFADCVPILLYDPAHSAVGIAHAGWRGTIAGAAREAVETMTATFGTRPSDLVVGIGPSIGPCCYEVGADVVAAVTAGQPSLDEAVLRRDDGPSSRTHFDLWTANRSVLISTGVPAHNIEVAGICTCCNRDRFYSHRGDLGASGRFAAIIGLRGET